MFNADQNYLAKFSPPGGAHSVCWERLFRIYYDDNDYYNLSILSRDGEWSREVRTGQPDQGIGLENVVE